MKFLILLLFSVTATASLVNTPPAQLTKDSPLADRQARTKSMVQMASTMGFGSLKNAVVQSYNQIFHNPLGLTVQQAEDALGTDACAAHMLYISVGQILNAGSPGSFTLVEPCTITCNQDGTANASCPQPSPSPSP